MRLCIFGNSHLASLKSGWDSLQSAHADFKVTFFGSRQSGLRGLQAKNGRLHAKTATLEHDLAYTSGGLAYVEPGDFDAFLVFALIFWPPHLKAEAVYSSGFIAASTRDAYERSLAFHLCKELRSVTDKRVLVGHTPMNASTDPNARLKDYNLIEPQMRSTVAEHGFELIRQPSVTLAETQFTKMEYCVGSRRLDVGDAISNQLHGDTDVEHMNADYGRLFMEAVLEKLRSD